MPAELNWRCPACLIRARVPCDVRKVVCACGYVQENGARPGLGDYVAAILHRLGITRVRYGRLRASLGFNTSCCGCERRQQAINWLGRWFGIG